MSEINKSGPHSNQHLPPMLVSRADARPSNGEQRRETSCDVAMRCEFYCLKDGSQQPENNQAKYHKKNGIEHDLVNFGSCCSSRTSKAWDHRSRGNYSAE
jgi:hypothetical protein